MSISPKPAIVISMTDKVRPPRALFPELSAAQIKLVREDFAMIEKRSAISGLVFYRHLFTLDPALKPLFHSGIEAQGRKLMEALEFTVATLDKPAELVPILEALGRRHVTYGARTEHYTTMTEALVLTLRESLGEGFSTAAEKAWRQALAFVCQAMLRGAAEVEHLKPDTGPESNPVALAAIR